MKIIKAINSKIRSKLIFGFVFISLFVAVVSYICLSTIWQIESDYNVISTNSISLTNILFFSGLTFFLSVLIGILYSCSISKPIIKLTQLTDDFWRGNLDATIDIKSGDEIGILGKSFNEMAKKIKLLISQLQDEVKLNKQIGESLTKSDQQIKLILEFAGDGILGLDLEGNLTSVNPTASKMLGYEIEELLGKHSHSLMHHSYQDGTPIPNEKCFIYETLHDDKPHYGEDYYWKKDGTGFPIEFSTVPIIENEMITGAVVTFSDITNRKRTAMENQVMYEITHGVSTTDSLDELLNLIHQSISKVVYAENCFVALYNQNTGLFSFPFFKDKFDSTPAPVQMDKSCSAYVFRTGKSLIITPEIFQQLKEQTEVELIGTNSPSWVGIPLYTPSRIIGVLVLQHYEEENVYNESNINFLDSIGSQIALAVERKLAEESLRESQSLYYSFIEQLPNAVFRKDSEGRYVIVNSEFCRLKGLKKEDFIGKKPLEVIENKSGKHSNQLHSDKYASLGEDIQHQILLTGKIFETEEEYSDTEGGIKHMHVVRMPVFDSHKNIIGSQGIMFDITKRKLAEEALRESEVKSKVILESTADGILAVDSKGKIIKTNMRFAELWRIPQSLIDSKDDNALLNFVMDQLIDPDEFISKVKRLYNSTDEDLDQLHFKDGRIFERFSAPFILNDSSIGRVWSFHDITKRKLVEEALQNERLLLRTLIDNIPDSIYSKDLACRKTIANLTELHYLGVKSEKEILGKTDFDFYPNGLAEGFFADDQSVMQSGEPVLNREEYLIDESGHQQWLLTSKLPLKDETGNIIGLVGIGRNITERKRAEEEIQKRNKQLLELNAEKDKFFSIIAHDLKSPFNGFLNMTKIMATESKDYTISELAEFSGLLNDTAVNLYKLLENLLDWSIIQQGKMSFNLQNKNLCEMVFENISTIIDRAKQKGISIVNQVDDSINVYVDEKMINTVLRNLISNAVKFTRKNGMITITAKSIVNGMIEIAVSDNGIGISENVIEKLFRIGEKIGSKGTDGELSTGLGLLLCKEFVEKNGGKIWVESIENVGSTFYFTLPKDN